jgi:hypothetical protein
LGMTNAPISGMTNDEIRMTNQIRNSNNQTGNIRKR